MDAGRTPMDTVSRRTRSRWDEYYINNYSKRKRKNQESGTVFSGDSGESLERGGVKNIGHVGISGRRRSRNVAGNRVEEGTNSNVAWAKKRKLDTRAKVDCDDVSMSDDDVEFLGEQVVSNGSSLKTGPESGSGSGSKVGNLDEVVSSITKKVGSRKVGIGCEGSSGRRGRGRPRIRPLEERQVHRDVSVDLEDCMDSGNSKESSGGSDESADLSLSDSESTSEEDEQLSDEDYKAGESSTSESSDDSGSGNDVELEKDDEYDVDENENLMEGEEENVSGTVEGKRKLGTHGKSRRLNARKEGDSEQEKDDESYEGCNVYDHGSRHCNRSSDQQKTDDVIIITDDEESFSVGKSGRISVKKETEVEIERDDEIDESTRLNARKESDTEQKKDAECYEGCNVDDHGSKHCNRSSDQQNIEDVIISIDEEEFYGVGKSGRDTVTKETEVELERDDEIDEGYHATDDCRVRNETSPNWKKNEKKKKNKKFPFIRRSTRINQKEEKDEDTFGSLTARNVSKKVEDYQNEIGCKTRNVFGLEVLVDSDNSNDKEEINLAKRLQPSTISKSQKEDPELGKYNSPVQIESSLSRDNEHKSSRDEDSCHIEQVVKRGQQHSEEKVKLGEKKSRAAKKFDLIKILVESMNALKEKQFTVDDNSLTQKTLPLRFRFEDEVLPPQEKSEWDKHIDSLFCDLDLGLRESEIECADSPVMENDELDTIEIDESPAARCGRGDHDPVLDEQIGIVCKYCAALILDIRYVLPPFYIPPSGRRDRKDSDESPSSYISEIHFPGSACKTHDSTSCATGTVWDLIPGIEKEMYPHQREGFEFIWKNIAGDIIIQNLKQPLSDGRGCIISHAPGTGKTRLTIVFLQTFLKLCPTCCPVIIAPRGMLLTWESEFIKWNVDIPFHNMNKKELSGNENAVATRIFGEVGARVLSKDCIRLLKLSSWMRGRSILGISYTLFEKLAGENGKEGLHEKIREVLLGRPGLLVLDEGHTPRNERSLIWKALSKVATQRRIILSGTPFQNNLIELYNTLCLVNPKFANQIGCETTTSCTTHGRKDSVARKRWTSLTSSIGKDRDDGLKKLRAMLDPFVHVHKGTILQESLPGLRHSLVFLHPSECQKTLLESSSKVKNVFRRIRLVSLVSVHPSLKAVMRRNPDEKSKLEEIESDVDAGVKAKFLMKLIWLADALGERVLVFSQFIDPLVFIKKQMESHLRWNEGRELLYMDGKLDEKQRQDSISSFNDDTSEAKVLLASERACSEGINLVGASRVILLDTVWNPSVEKQAISRAYRLGQKKVVYVYRLFTSGFEVRLFAQQIKKERISQLIFSPGDGETYQSQNSRVVSEDKVLEAMLNLDKFNHIFEKVIYQPKESDLIEIFGLKKQN